MAEKAERIAIDDEEHSRALLYGLLAMLLVKPPDDTLLDEVSRLKAKSADPLGNALGALARVARTATAGSVETEFNALFIGVGRGELLPYCSYYMTGFLNEKPLAELRRDMDRLSIQRTPEVSEPEDHIASLMEMMGGLILGRFGEPADLRAQKEFFDRHVGIWAGHFFADLESAKNSVFYAPVGSAGNAFIELEKESFKLAAGELLT